MAMKYGAKTFYEFLKTATGGLNAQYTTGGTGTGASTGSTQGGTLTAGPGTGKKWLVKSMQVDLGAGSSDIYSTKYAGVAALTVGAKVLIKTATGTRYYMFGTTSITIKDNHGWAKLADNSQLFAGWKDNRDLAVRIDFPDAYGKPTVVLDGDAGEKIAVWFDESTTGFVRHNYSIKGIELDK